MITNSKSRRLRRLYGPAAFLIALGLLTVAAAGRAGRTFSATITVVNNSTLEIRHLYLTAPTSDNWSADRLGESAIAPGGSFALNDVSSDQGNIKVIAEDQNGCFFYKTVDCSSNSTWTIASDATPDCGG